MKYRWFFALVGALMLASSSASAAVNYSQIPAGMPLSPAAITEANTITGATTATVTGVTQTTPDGNTACTTPPNAALPEMSPGMAPKERVIVGYNDNTCQFSLVTGTGDPTKAAAIVKQEQELDNGISAATIWPQPFGTATDSDTGTIESSTSWRKTRAFVRESFWLPNCDPSGDPCGIAYVGDRLRWQYTSSCIRYNSSGSVWAWQSGILSKTHGQLVRGANGCQQAYAASWAEWNDKPMVSQGAWADSCPQRHSSAGIYGDYRNSIHGLPGGHFQTYEGVYICDNFQSAHNVNGIFATIWQGYY